MTSFTRDFHHPYEPYAIQQELMTAVYDCIAEGKVGIFESPTGTGKSLSLICSTLTWLREEQERAVDPAVDLDGRDGEPTWLGEQARRRRTEKLVQHRLDLESRLDKIRDNEARQKRMYEGSEPAAKRAKGSLDSRHMEVEDERQFLLDDYESDSEARESASANETPGPFSAATLHLMQKLGGPSTLATPNADIELTDDLKVFFCSRTHSQLTQFISELRRVHLPPAPWADRGRGSSFNGVQQRNVVKHLPLGSRKNLCINPKVLNAGNAVAINERCLDLQQPSTPQDKKCTFLPNKDNEVLVNDFRDHTLAKIRDVEDLGILGKHLRICPYYSARATIKPSEVFPQKSWAEMDKFLTEVQIVTLPYQLLLMKSAREALGISLKDHVVVIDEAHNLMDAIASMYSIAVTQSQLNRCQAQLRAYLQKFRKRLQGKNRVYVTQTVRLIDSIAECLEKTMSTTRNNEIQVSVSDLMGGKGVDQINLYKLVRYLGQSKLARKVDSYIDFALQKGANGGSDSHGGTTPVLTHVQGFLQSLMNPAAEGRFFAERDESKAVTLKYMLLDPTFHFKEVVDDARAVVLAGGTMSPMGDYARHLFSYVPPERLKTWSCGHIIPEDNLFVRCIGQSSDGMELDFSFAKRESMPMIDALGNCLLHMAATIPDGLVVFFPSYAYLAYVLTQWQTLTCNSITTRTRLEKLKPVFQESKVASHAEDVLQQYSKAIDDGRGGILLSVVGGKLSEGINFSDKLGRGVAVVGLPFPNIHSAQWKAKLEYIERSIVDGGGSSMEGKAAGRELYENACMRAVNQSIGRAIRHQKDFASILLLDRRYSTPRIGDKLPSWIKQALPLANTAPAFSETVRGLRNFFQAKP
ncbi:MAG: hypothetical protein L6R35_000345 [Caloplaca aegaea]|nr:MAG: hypothetical protein L6R35_000345 [Caloplaca aegaea]